MLLNNDADCNIIDHTKYPKHTPLYMAGRHCHKTIMTLLLEHGAFIYDDLFKVGNLVKFWKKPNTQELILQKQPWNLGVFENNIGFSPDIKVKYEDLFLAYDLAI